MVCAVWRDARDRTRGAGRDKIAITSHRRSVSESSGDVRVGGAQAEEDYDETLARRTQTDQARPSSTAALHLLDSRARVDRELAQVTSNKNVLHGLCSLARRT